jgi:hypothetical protein
VLFFIDSSVQFISKDQSFRIPEQFTDSWLMEGLLRYGQNKESEISIFGDIIPSCSIIFCRWTTISHQFFSTWNWLWITRRFSTAWESFLRNLTVDFSKNVLFHDIFPYRCFMKPDATHRMCKKVGKSSNISQYTVHLTNLFLKIIIS